MFFLLFFIHIFLIFYFIFFFAFTHLLYYLLNYFCMRFFASKIVGIFYRAWHGRITNFTNYFAANIQISGERTKRYLWQILTNCSMNFHTIRFEAEIPKEYHLIWFFCCCCFVFFVFRKSFTYYMISYELRE